MMDFFTGMDPYLRVLWFIALPVSLIFVIQLILTLIGMDSSDGADVDFEGDFDGGDMPFQLFSFRNLINFLIGFSWGGIAFFDKIESKFVLTIVAFIIGTGMLIMFFLIIRQIMKLSQDNTMKLSSAIGETATVYLLIPGENKGKGKVHVKVNETLREIDAVTDGEALPTGTIVRVTETINETILKVEKL
jgi:membrane protein implicated in regulation of membrane protease activity